MRKIDYKVMVLSCLVILIPIVLGIMDYNNINDVFAIHFGGGGDANRTVSKVFGVFYSPVLIIAIQVLLCVSLDLKGEKTPFISIVKNIIPIAHTVLQISLIYYNIGEEISIRKWVIVVVGLIFVVLGNYLPKESYVTEGMTNLPKSFKEHGRYKTINKTAGYSFVIAGILIILCGLFLL